MSAEEMSNGIAPPYVPYRTMRTFVDGLRQAIPQRIDRSVMPSIAGTTQRQLLSALRYLRLIDENGIPQEILGRWVKAEGNERQEILRGILQGGYPSLLGNFTGGFDLATATSKQFTEKFQAFAIQRDTLRKAEAFFLNAASDAGLTISSYIKKPSRQQGEGRRPGRPRNSQKSRRRTNPEEIGEPLQNRSGSIVDQKGPSSPLSSSNGLLQAFVTKLPDFNPEWAPEVQNNWFEALKQLMTLQREGHQAEGGNKD